MELRYRWEYGGEKARINELNEKRSLIPLGLRVLIWKINFCSRVLPLSKLTRCRERPRTVICCLGWFGRLKCLATGLDASLSFLSTSRRCSRNRSRNRLPICYAVNDIGGGSRYEWKDKFCNVSERTWKFQVGHWFEMNLRPKSCRCFCHVWIKLVKIAKR